MARIPSFPLFALALVSGLSALPRPACAEDSAVRAASATTQAPAGTDAAAPTTTIATSPIDCVEVALFKVSEEKVEGQTERAEQIPQRNLEIIQSDIVGFLPKMAHGVSSVAAGGQHCPNAQTAAVVSGDILDFRKGNMALRYFIGFGAGAQKVRVRLTVSRVADGTTIGQQEIADTKWGGAFGGSNTKGLADFSEKAAKATAQILKMR
jgi:hypothetical protein